MKSSTIGKFAAILAIILFVAACSKDSTPAFQGKTKTYPLYNYSNPGVPAAAGTFTITELENGNAKGTVNLNSGFTVSGATFQSNITFRDTAGNEFVYAPLANVDGTTGVGETAVITTGSSNAPISYNALIGKTGYLIKVLNGSNLQAVGTIE